MDYAARQFARRVLFTHVALLCVVLLVVALAAKYLYDGARSQVIRQAEETQKLLARQTAIGIDNYYESITSVLNLVQPPGAENLADRGGRGFGGGRSGGGYGFGGRGQRQGRPPGGPGGPGGPNQGPGQGFGPPRGNGPFANQRPTTAPTTQEREQRLAILENNFVAGPFSARASAAWESISDKASIMFIVDPIDAMRIVQVIGKSDDAPAPADVVKEASIWLQTVKEKKSISTYMPNVSGGAHLVCVPVHRPVELLVVAVIPVSDLELSLLQFVNSSASTGSMLVDEQGTFISSSIPEAFGKKVKDFEDPRIREMAQKYMSLGVENTQTFDTAPKLGNVVFKPSMCTIEPIQVLGDRRWFVIIASSLDEVDKVVKPIFRDAMLWAVFVMIAVMGILISTAVQMIRSRLRLERAQMELINKELADARQIQLNWLPDQPCSLEAVDIAALNLPASHVSGDFYNWFELDDGRLVVTIGDVTGHGMSAAFLMATTQLLVRTTMPIHCDPGLCMTEVNRQLCTQVFSGQFVTMLIMIIDVQNGWIDIATAGHPTPLVDQGDLFQRLKMEPQLVLGVERDLVYPTQRFPLSAEASLLLYTDGVVDAEAPNGQRFKVQRLSDCLNREHATAQSMIQAVTSAINNFRTGRDLGDDLTMVAVQVQTSAARVGELVGAK